MSRSHPPTLLTLARAALTREIGIARGDRVLVAVSGGPDSMALLHVMATLRDRVGHELVAHGVDHGLREEAAAELDLAEGLARSLDVPFDRSVLAVAPGGNLQARAREARLAALDDAASRASCAFVATAHHADDRAETVLLRLLRGAGPRGLAVLPPREAHRIRPFVRAPKAAIVAHVERHGLPFATDPSNASPRFLRVRVRRELMPLLVELSPSIVEHLCALADQLAPAERESSAVAIPRATQRALLQVIQTRRGEVWLPGDLIARPAPTPRDRSRRIKKDEPSERRARR